MTNRTVVTQDAMRKLFREPEMQAALDETATDIVEAIKDNAPVKSGQYQDSIRVRRFPLSRRVYTTDIAGHIIEWGNGVGAGVEHRAPYGPGGGPTIAYAPFRRAVRALRLKFKPSPKGGGSAG